MNLSETKTNNVITKPNLHSTLRVLHNLWLDGNLDIIELDTILRKDYEVIVQFLEPDFMCVESLDGLSKFFIGDGEKYKQA